MRATRILGMVLYAAIMVGLPFLIGVAAGAVAGRRRAGRWANSGGFGLALIVALAAQYLGLYFAATLWLADGHDGREPPVRLRDIVAGFALYCMIGGMVSGPLTLGGYLMGYFRTRDRAAAPTVGMTFPNPPPGDRTTPSDRSPS